jgi:hypothetical protein
LDHFRLAARHEAEASVDALPPAKFRDKTGKLIRFSNPNWGLKFVEFFIPFKNDHPKMEK